MPGPALPGHCWVPTQNAKAAPGHGLAQRQKQLSEVSTAAFQISDIETMCILKEELNECSDASRKEALLKQIMTHHKEAEKYRSIYREFNALLLESERLFEQYKVALGLESR